MEVRTSISETRSITGLSAKLPWLGEIASVYSASALKMDWHMHSETEVICCVKGVMVYEFLKRATVTLKSGETLVIPPCTEHRLSSGIDAPSRRVSFLVKAKRDRNMPFSVFTDADFQHFRKLLLRKSYRPTPFSHGTRETIMKLGGFLHRQPQIRLSSTEMSEVRVLICSLFLDCAHEKRPAGSKPEVRLMDEAVIWLENHFAEKFSIPLLMEHMGYGRTRFFHLFKEKTGLSPHDYLIRLRIRKARNLLQDGRTSVKHVAAQVGFTDPAFFARSFKRHTGLPPSAFNASAANRNESSRGE